MLDFSEKETHPSYGMLSFSRVTCSRPQNLFGSSIQHSNVIKLQIAAGAWQRGLSNDWYFRENEYIEVEMSYAQFAEAITSLNAGSGVPVTLTFLRGEKIDPCPFVSSISKYEDEFKDGMESGAQSIKDSIRHARELLSKKGVSKADIQNLLNDLEAADRSISSNAPFVYKQFNERIEKTVMEAKAEIEGIMLQKIMAYAEDHRRIAEGQDEQTV